MDTNRRINVTEQPEDRRTKELLDKIQQQLNSNKRVLLQKSKDAGISITLAGNINR
jgi:hypothetical protein